MSSLMLTFTCQECTMTALHFKSNNTKWYTCLKPWAHNAVGEKVQNIYKNKKKKTNIYNHFIHVQSLAVARWGSGGVHHRAQHLVTGEADFTNTITKKSAPLILNNLQGRPVVVSSPQKRVPPPTETCKNHSRQEIIGLVGKGLTRGEKDSIERDCGSVVVVFMGQCVFFQRQKS